MGQSESAEESRPPQDVASNAATAGDEDDVGNLAMIDRPFSAGRSKGRRKRAISPEAPQSAARMAKRREEFRDFLEEWPDYDEAIHGDETDNPFKVNLSSDDVKTYYQGRVCLRISSEISVSLRQSHQNIVRQDFDNLFALAVKRHLKPAEEGSGAAGDIGFRQFIEKARQSQLEGLTSLLDELSLIMKTTTSTVTQELMKNKDATQRTKKDLIVAILKQVKRQIFNCIEASDKLYKSRQETFEQDFAALPYGNTEDGSVKEILHRLWSPGPTLTDPKDEIDELEAVREKEGKLAPKETESAALEKLSLAEEKDGTAEENTVEVEAEYDSAEAKAYTTNQKEAVKDRNDQSKCWIGTMPYREKRAIGSSNE